MSLTLGEEQESIYMVNCDKTCPDECNSTWATNSVDSDLQDASQSFVGPECGKFYEDI